MSYFSNSFNDFWAELALNNEKSWFDANRKRYISDVKKPWEAFMTDLIEGVRQFDDINELPVTKFVSRINRDIRFSNDKTPYSSHVWAAIAKDGKKTMLPGYYIHLGVEGMYVGGGMHHPDKEALLAIRRALVKDAASFRTEIEKPDFKSKYSEIKGDKNKVLPAEFKNPAKDEPLIAHKSWYYMAHYDDVDTILRDDLLDFVLAHFRAGAPLNAWLKNAL